MEVDKGKLKDKKNIALNSNAGTMDIFSKEGVCFFEGGRDRVIFLKELRWRWYHLALTCHPLATFLKA